MSALICHNQQRRERVRQHHQLNGIDYLEVSRDQTLLTVYFLGKAPVVIGPDNVRIEGGRRIRNIRVTDVQVHRFEQVEFDDYMEVTVAPAGDHSTYLLRVVEKDSAGNWRPHSGFDQRYNQIEFNFKIDCPGDLDCKQSAICPPQPQQEPDINYLARDYASFRQLILDRLALVMPEWRERHIPDLGVALVEILAYVGDYLSYYQDAVATEAYLDTARKRISVRRHARLVDYPMHDGCNARTWVCIETDSDQILPAGDAFFTTSLAEAEPDAGAVLPAHTLQQIPPGSYEIFEPITRQEIPLYRDHSRIRFYTWGDTACCLPKGTTTATLVGELVAESSPPDEPCPPPDRPNNKQEADDATQQPPEETETAAPKLHLKPGDVLIFTEVIGPGTGHPGDADPNHRHAVRLTAVEAGTDPLNGQPVVEIQWAEQDALPFPLCLSALGPPPECDMLEDISIACGNVILADHGKTVAEDLDPVPPGETTHCCRAEHLPADTIVAPGPYHPQLKHAPLTFAEPAPDGAPASRALRQDPRQALPQITLHATHPVSGEARWSTQRDLLGSDSDARHFVAETDNDGRARLRFGDGQSGRRPAAGTAFRATYRIGNGVRGNIGSDAIAHLLLRNTKLSGITRVHNPLPAVGGTAPEPIAEVKLFAPHAFRKKLQRAIIADDYAAIVQREFGDRVQRAAARLRWAGSWYEVLVAVDPWGEEQADPGLLNEIAGCLHRYRRIGHDLVVKPARRVPLDIGIRVCVLPDYLRGHIEAELRERFSNRLLANGQRGFFHVDNLSFGDDICLSRLVAAAQAVPGVESVQVTRLQRLNELPNNEIEKGVLPLGPFEIARLDNDPGQPENGRLTLDMRGGR